MIQWQEELWNVECEGTRSSSFWPTRSNDVRESNTSIRSGFEFESTKLARVKKIVGGEREGYCHSILWTLIIYFQFSFIFIFISFLFWWQINMCHMIWWHKAHDIKRIITLELAFKNVFGMDNRVDAIWKDFTRSKTCAICKFMWSLETQKL